MELNNNNSDHQTEGSDQRLPYEKPTIATMEVTLAHLSSSQTGCSQPDPDQSGQNFLA